ncbi:MAG: CGLD27 family protein [Elainellaceae cyanobacterium]
MPSSAPVCPVPTEQQPINEYQELRESWFFRWATLDLWGYLKPIGLLWSISWLVAGPVSAVSFSPAKFPGQFILFGAAGATVLPLLALVHLYLGWIYVRDRLAKPKVAYEESGWYDGQVWTKPDEVLQRDRLIVTYQIQSILKRLQLTFVAIGLLFLVGGITWQFL